jgi:hypothetical protein
MSRRVAIALVHHPIVDASGGVVTTAVTNLDVHDLSRSARTYGCSDYFVVHPIAAQRELVERIVDHWTNGSSGTRIPDRKVALAVLRTATSLDEVAERMGGRGAIEVWVTAARKQGEPTTFADAKALLGTEGKPVLVVFGTGWGLAPEVIKGADRVIEPIFGPSDYNHLSVRAACAIVLDRLLG